MQPCRDETDEAWLDLVSSQIQSERRIITEWFGLVSMNIFKMYFRNQKQTSLFALSSPCFPVFFLIWAPADGHKF